MHCIKYGAKETKEKSIQDTRLFGFFNSLLKENTCKLVVKRVCGVKVFQHGFLLVDLISEHKQMLYRQDVFLDCGSDINHLFNRKKQGSSLKTWFWQTTVNWILLNSACSWYLAADCPLLFRFWRWIAGSERGFKRTAAENANHLSQPCEHKPPVRLQACMQPIPATKQGNLHSG